MPIINTFDLIPSENELEILFVMESPHNEELHTNLPCSGSSGIRMANRIFRISNKSFGEILKTNIVPESQKYGVINTFPFPLAETNEYIHSESEKYYCSLKSLNYIKGHTTREMFYNDHFNILKDIVDLESISGLKQRLDSYLVKCKNLKTVVFNGYISQSVFMKLYNKFNFPYNRKVLIEINKFKINVLFVNHPSEKNVEWHYNN